MDSGIPFISAPVPPEVTNLSNEELEELVECDDLLDEFVLQLPHVVAISEQCDKLAQENVQLANRNLSLSSECEAARDRTLQGIETLTDLHLQFEQLSLHSQALAVKLQPSSIQEHMSIAAAQSEEDSECIAEQFLEQKIDVDAFLRAYLEKRVEAHLRKFKSDRLASQLRQLQQAGF